MRPMHYLSVNVEEHFQEVAFDSPIRRRYWDSLESRVERNTETLLELLAAQEVRATFFVLGWVAERHGDLVRRLAADGHEVASLGYANELVTAQTPVRFREDVRRAKEILEDLTGRPVWGYRAPDLMLSDETAWAPPILVEEGYRYDSSLIPLKWRDNGAARGCAPVHRLSTASGPLWVIPPTTLGPGGRGLPVTSGFALRLLTYPLLQSLLLRLEAQGRSLVVYVRSWEIDSGQPPMSGRVLDRFQHYFNLDKVEGRLSRLLRDFRFAPLVEGLDPIDETARVA